jgi:hypothetical protein
MVEASAYKRMDMIEDKVKNLETFEQLLVDRFEYSAVTFGKWHVPEGTAVLHRHYVAVLSSVDRRLALILSLCPDLSPQSCTTRDPHKGQSSTATTTTIVKAACSSLPSSSSSRSTLTRSITFARAVSCRRPTSRTVHSSITTATRRTCQCSLILGTGCPPTRLPRRTMTTSPVPESQGPTPRALSRPWSGGT